MAAPPGFGTFGSGKKTMKALSERPNDAAGSGYSSFATGLMAKMGWNEGEGLGKNKQGRTSYVRVEKKVEPTGLGLASAQRADAADNWYFAACTTALAAFKALDSSSSGKKKKKKRKETEAAASSTDAGELYAEMYRATGGARMGMRARASQSAKLARCEGGATAEAAASEEGSKAAPVDAGDSSNGTAVDSESKEARRARKRARKESSQALAAVLDEAAAQAQPLEVPTAAVPVDVTNAAADDAARSEKRQKKALKKKSLEPSASRRARALEAERGVAVAVQA